MLDLTTSRNLEGATRVAAKPLSLRRLMPVSRIPRISGNAGMVLAFFAAASVWAAMDLLLRASTPKPAVPAENRRIQTAHIDAMVKEILDRPLFSSGRSPAPEPPSPEELAKLQPPVLKSHLIGITILPSSRLALFAADGNKYQTVREGEEIDGFKVRAIAADQVILASAFGEQIARPAKGVSQTVRNTKPVELGNFDPDKN